MAKDFRLILCLILLTSCSEAPSLTGLSGSSTSSGYDEDTNNRYVCEADATSGVRVATKKYTCPKAGEWPKPFGHNDWFYPDLEVKSIVTDETSTYEDYCDSQGDLVEHWCGSPYANPLLTNWGDCGPDPTSVSSPCYWAGVGVQQTRVQCNGQCVRGTCPGGRAPGYAEVLTFVSSRDVESTHSDIHEIIAAFGEIFNIQQRKQFVMDNQTDGKRYTCYLFWDMVGDSYNCANDFRAGDRIKIAAIPGATYYPFYLDKWFNIGTDHETVIATANIPPRVPLLKQNCSFTCTQGPSVILCGGSK